MMRQTLAMCIVLLSIPYIYKKKVIIAALFILFASLFHSSAKILLPIVSIFSQTRYRKSIFNYRCNNILEQQNSKKENNANNHPLLTHSPIHKSKKNYLEEGKEESK